MKIFPKPLTGPKILFYRKRKKIGWFIIFLSIFVNLIFLILIILKTNYPIISSNKNVLNPGLDTVNHSSHIYDPAFFDQAYERGKKYKKIIGTRVLGGLIPHHLLAASLIAGFFEGIKNQQVDTIIILGPNHYNAGPANISVSNGVWNTIYGKLQTSTDKIVNLVNDKAVIVSEDLFENEHSIYGITGFIKRSFPKARIIPIVVKSSTTLDESDKLVESLLNIIDDRTLVVASVDLSHYLTSDEADNYDKESLGAIKTFDLKKIIKLDYEKNFDSPLAIYTLLKIMKTLEVDNSILISNTNSAKLTNQSALQNTTSYATIYFTSSALNLSLDSIFSYEDPLPQNVKKRPDTYTLIATGDIIPARSVNARMVELNNFDYPFERVTGFLKEADAVFINLESPFVDHCPTTYEGMIFCGDEKVISGLVKAGISVASIANNHINNYGLEGIINTVKLLRENNIAVTGNNQPAIVRIKNKSFGFLGYNDIGVKEEGIAFADPDQIRKDITNLKNEVDFIIVAFHWGIEYVSDPSFRQIELAHTTIDAGADLVIGNHPHWVQGIEQYNGKFITYAHGNFIFDQMWSQETREGVIGKYIFDDNGLTEVKFYPVIIEDYAQPRFATIAEAEKIFDLMKKSSLKLKS